MAWNEARKAVLAYCITIALLAGVGSADVGPGFACLEYRTSSPVHSYFEGLRGRYPLWTPATADDPLALWINPASLGTGKSKGLCYIHTYTNSTFSGDDAFSLSFGGFGFGAEFFDLEDTPRTAAGDDLVGFATRRYTLALGGRLGWNFYMGTSYAWHTSKIPDIDTRSSWTVGALFRPHRRASVGLVARDLNAPKYYGTTFKPIYEVSLAFRPFDERFALFVNWLGRSETLKGNLHEPQPTSFFTFGLDYELLEGIILKLGGDEEENLSVSLSLLFGRGGLGSMYTGVKGEGDAKAAGFGALVATSTPSWRESVLMPPGNYLEIDLSGQIGEARPPFRLFGGGGPRHTLNELLTRIERAKQARDVGAIVLRCGSMAANFAIYDELRQALKDFKDTGKPLIAYVEDPGNGVYYLASAADYIVLTPNGYVGLVGLKSETPFFRGTLDKVGVKAYYARVGKYKSAVEPLTEDEYTQPSKEAYNALLDDVYTKMVRDIASGRGLTPEEVKEKIDRGPFIPSEALREGLVDTLAYWDEIPGILRRLMPQATDRLPYRQFAKREPLNFRWDEPPVVGIVFGVGGIMHGSNRKDMLVGDIMGSETIAAAFRSMREDRSVRAVVFRVDSPGGMMTASDKIRREVELTARQKPVIVSMGGVAASGGYHISCDGTMILADEATVTGSIGVLNLWLHTRGLYEKIGANKDIFLRGDHADIFPSWRDVTEQDIELAQYYVDKFYDKFVSDVAEGRAMAVGEVRDVAQGRVWSGRRAHDLGLVDRIGGLSEAIKLAKEKAGIAPRETVEFKVLPKPAGFFDALRQSIAETVAGDFRLPEDLAGIEGLEAFMEGAKEAAYLTGYDEPILYLMPYAPDIE